MRLIIPGGLGYVGARLVCAEWPGVEERVVIDDHSAGAAVADAPPPHARLIAADVCDWDIRRELAPGDIVIHLAAVTGLSAAASPRLRRVNVDVAANVARACADVGARLLFLSSTSVYEAFDGNVDESADLLSRPPVSAYARSKADAESAIRNVASVSPLRWATLRCGTMFGVSPVMRTHTAINRFCWQWATGQPLTVWQHALSQRRPYLDLADAIRAIEHVCHLDLFGGEVFNVVTETRTVAEVVRLMRRAGGEGRVDVVDAPVACRTSQDVSTTKLRNTGFTFRGSLENGIRDTLQLMARAATASTSRG